MYTHAYTGQLARPWELYDPSVAALQDLLQGGEFYPAPSFLKPEYIATLVRIYTYIHTYIHTCINTYINTCIHTNTYIHTCVCVCVCVCVYTHTHTHMHACICMHVCMYVYTHTHTHTGASRAADHPRPNRHLESRRLHFILIGQSRCGPRARAQTWALAPLVPCAPGVTTYACVCVCVCVCVCLFCMYVYMHVFCVFL
jgi:hypothetical protein